MDQGLKRPGGLKMSKESELLRSLFHIKKIIFDEIGKGFMAEGLTSVEVMVLYRIKHGMENQKISELAKEMGIPASTFTGIMDRLVEKNYILRERSEEDRRTVTIKIKEDLCPPMNETNPVSQYLQEVLAETEPGWTEDFIARLQYLESILEQKQVK